MEKPSEFFVGVLDLFAILLPGAVATALLKKAAESWDFASLVALPAGEAAEWATFLLVAYALGHLIFQVGSLLEDQYEKLRNPWDAGDDRNPYRAAEALRDGLLTEGERKAIKTFQWARSTLLIQCPAAAQDVHRLEADSKFFRSLFVVGVIATLFLLSPEHAAGGLVTALLSGLCFYLYRKRRAKSIKQACIHVIALHRAGGGKERTPTGET